VYLFLLFLVIFVALCYFYCIGCTNVGLLPPGENPIAVVVVVVVKSYAQNASLSLLRYHFVTLSSFHSLLISCKYFTQFSIIIITLIVNYGRLVGGVNGHGFADQIVIPCWGRFFSCSPLAVRLCSHSSFCQMGTGDYS
jgi:hypothetical protein